MPNSIILLHLTIFPRKGKNNFLEKKNILAFFLFFSKDIF